MVFTDLHILLKTLEKEEQMEPKESKRKEINIKAERNARKMYYRINKSKCFFKESYKSDKPMLTDNFFYKVKNNYQE